MHNNDSSSEVQPSARGCSLANRRMAGSRFARTTRTTPTHIASTHFRPLRKRICPQTSFSQDCASRLTHHRNRPVMASRMPGPRRHESVLVADRDRGRHAAHALLGRLPDDAVLKDSGSARNTYSPRCTHSCSAPSRLTNASNMLSPGNPRKGSVTRPRPNACIGRRSWKDSRRIVPSSSNSPYSSSYHSTLSKLSVSATTRRVDAGFFRRSPTQASSSASSAAPRRAEACHVREHARLNHSAL